VPTPYPPTHKDQTPLTQFVVDLLYNKLWTCHGCCGFVVDLLCMLWICCGSAVYDLIIMPPPLIGGGIKRCFCLTSVVYIGPKSRTERSRKTKIGSEVAHVTIHHFQGKKVKGQGHQAAFLTAVLARQAAAAVDVATCWPWETLPSAWRCKALWHPRGRRGVVAYHGGHPPTACFVQNDERRRYG